MENRITEFDALVAEEAVLKEATKIHKAKVDSMKMAAIENGTPMRSKLFGLKNAGLDLVEGTDPEPFVRYSISDAQKVFDWMDATRPDTDGFASDNIEAFCQWWFEHTGELPDGFERIEGMTEGKAISARFVVRKPEAIIEQMRDMPELTKATVGNLLGAEATPLLEGAR